MPNPQNIEQHKFKKGESGNPKGRPPVLPVLKDAVAKMLSEEQHNITGLDAMIRKLFQMALSGNVRAAQELLDRGYGKPTQYSDINLTTEQPIFKGIDLDVKGNDSTT